MGKYVIENEKGKFTAVLISPDYGAGYSTWGYGDCMDGELIKELLENVDGFNPNEVDSGTEIDVSDYMTNDFRSLFTVCFVPVGTLFRISEYDGSEHIVYFNESDFYEA
jgi:hypothetical protein